jgi:hypothetical protein
MELDTLTVRSGEEVQHATLPPLDGDVASAHPIPCIREQGSCGNRNPGRKTLNLSSLHTMIRSNLKYAMVVPYKYFTAQRNLAGAQRIPYDGCLYLFQAWEKVGSGSILPIWCRC